MSPRPIVLAVANRRKPGMRPDDPALVEQRQPPGDLEHALDDEHHVGAAGVVFVEADRDVVLQRPRQHAVAKLGDLLAVLEHDRVLADEVDARDVAVEIDAHQRPVEPGGDLLDVGRLAGAVIAGDHHPAIEGEARQDRERGVAVEQIVGIEVRHVLVGRRDSPALSCPNRCGTPRAPKSARPGAGGGGRCGRRRNRRGSHRSSMPRRGGRRGDDSHYRRARGRAKRRSAHEIKVKIARGAAAGGQTSLLALR